MKKPEIIKTKKKSEIQSFTVQKVRENFVSTLNYSVLESIDIVNIFSQFQSKR